MTIDDKLSEVPGNDNTDVTLQFSDEFHGRHYEDAFQEWGVEDHSRCSPKSPQERF